jgi:hypothetical protein
MLCLILDSVSQWRLGDLYLLTPSTLCRWCGARIVYTQLQRLETITSGVLYGAKTLRVIAIAFAAREGRVKHMTDRAEIERLLNQTGRTLEGLPEQYDDYAVMKRINEVTGSYRCAGNTALLASNSLHQSDVIELLVGALRDALDKQREQSERIDVLREMLE